MRLSPGRLRQRRRLHPARALAAPEWRARWDPTQSGHAHDRRDQRLQWRRPRENLRWTAAIVDTIKKKVPGVKVLLLSVLPRNDKTGLRVRHGREPVAAPPRRRREDREIPRHHREVHLARGTVPKDVMPDGTHLSDKGYQIWADAVEQPLKDLMGTKEARGLHSAPFPNSISRGHS